MIELNEIKKWRDKIIPIIIDADIALANMRILRIEENNGLKEILHTSFKNYWHQQRFILIIQLAKLFSESSNQKFNLIKLCKYLENEEYDNGLKEQIEINKLKITSVFKSKEDIDSCVNEFKDRIDANIELINKIRTLRDKVFAHSDSIESKPQVKYGDFEILIELSKKICNTLIGKIVDAHFEFRTSDCDLRYIIKHMQNATK